MLRSFVSWCFPCSIRQLAAPSYEAGNVQAIALTVLLVQHAVLSSRLAIATTTIWTMVRTYGNDDATGLAGAAIDVCAAHLDVCWSHSFLRP